MAIRYHALLMLAMFVPAIAVAAEGGWQARAPLPEARTDDSWQRAAILPTGRSGVGVTTHAGQLYVFGGETFGEQRRTFNNVERYDAATDRWEALSPMPTARHGMGVASYDGRIYTIAGGPGAGLTFSSVNEVFSPPQAD